MKSVPIKPLREEFNVPEEKVAQYNRLRSELEECRNSSTTNHKAIGYIVFCYVVCFIIAIVHWEGVLDIEGILCILLGSVFVAWLSGVLLMSIVNTICKKFPNTQEDRLLNEIRILEPVVKSYDVALRKYNSEIANYRKMYEGIQDVNYDRDKYIKSKENDLLSRLNKEMDYLENIAKKDWWFNLSPLEFENEVAEWYRRQGYEAKTTSYVADGGYDIILTKDGQKTYVQCKHYTNKSSVGVSVMRELFGVITADKVSKGILVCLCKPTQAAMDFAHANGIDIVMVSELSSKATPLILDRTIRYVPDNGFIGSLNPYMYIGDIGVIFNLFHHRQDAQDYVRELRSKGIYATYFLINDLYYIITSQSELLTRMKCYNNPYI